MRQAALGLNTRIGLSSTKIGHMAQLSGLETRKRIRELGIDRSRRRAFALGGVQDPVTYDWHSHRSHQLIYAFEGSLAVESESRRHLLAVRCAALIPAGLMHRTTQAFAVVSAKRVVAPRVTSVFFDLRWRQRWRA